MAVFFSPTDGRRVFFRNEDRDVPQHCLGYRPFDHLVEAVDDWAEQVHDIAEVVMELVVVLLGTEDEVCASGRLCSSIAQRLMLHLLSLALVGRPRVSASLPFGRKICCYRLKFIFTDILFLVAAICCRRSRGRPAFVAHQLPQVPSSSPCRCPCIACGAVWRLREDFIFIGPSSHNLFFALRGHAAGHAPTMAGALDDCRLLRQFLCEVFSAKFDLYTPQLLPCSWRKWWRKSQCDQTVQVRTGPREVQERLSEFERHAIRTVMAGLSRFGLAEHLWKMPAAAQRKFLTALVWSDPQLTKQHVIDALEACAREVPA
jgi:hypothetical protein